MFAGDTESVLSVDPAPRVRRSKSSAAYCRHQPQYRHGSSSNNPFGDPVGPGMVEVREEEFGWSGSVSGIRGRDDRQIERDVEYERKMEERTRKRHERKLARQQQARGTPRPDAGSSSRPSITEPPSYERITATNAEGTRRRPVFAPTELDLQRLERASTTHQTTDHPDSPPRNLTRGKSLKDRVGAALGRWHSIGRSKSVSALDTPQPVIEKDRVERKETLGGLVRRLSRKITIEDHERRRREREDGLYAEPPLLSRTLVGAASPFPMRPALSSLVPAEELRYGEAHTDYSPNPYRRRRNLSDTTRFRAQPITTENLA